MVFWGFAREGFSELKLPSRAIGDQRVNQTINPLITFTSDGRLFQTTNHVGDLQEIGGKIGSLVFYITKV